MHNDFSNKCKIISALLASTMSACALMQKTSPTAAKPCTAKNTNNPKCNKQPLSSSPPKIQKKMPENSKRKPPQVPTAPKDRKTDQDELPNRKEDEF